MLDIGRAGGRRFTTFSCDRTVLDYPVVTNVDQMVHMVMRGPDMLPSHTIDIYSYSKALVSALRAQYDPRQLFKLGLLGSGCYF